MTPTAPELQPQRPRAFRNLGSSCYMNATLHALFGSASVRRVLRGLWDGTPDSLRMALRDIVVGADGSEAMRPRETDFSRCSDDVRLAVIFHTCLEPPRAQPLIPCLLTDRYYRGEQEDAQEFLQTAFLQNEAGDVARLFRGDQQYWMQCRACGHQTVQGPTTPFTVLQLPVTSTDGFQHFDCVQQAMDYHLSPEVMDAAYRFECEDCGSAVPPARVMRVEQHPQVLALHLRRWNPVQLDAPYSHVVVPDAHITVSGTSYALAGFACHLGNSNRCGHYTAVMRYPDAASQWWFYDDTRVMLAKEHHRRTEVDKKLYLAFYERETAGSASAAVGVARPASPAPGGSHSAVQQAACSSTDAFGSSHAASLPTASTAAPRPC